MTWEVGDLALCVDAGVIQVNGSAADADNLLHEGQVYRVKGVVVRDGVWRNAPALRLTEIPHHRGFAQVRFRKIKPDSHEGEIEDWQLLLDSMKRKVGA